jgi:hypothetical protein
MTCDLERALSYGSAISDLLGAVSTPDGRALAKWKCCDDVVRHLGEYRPYPVPPEPLEVQRLRRADLEDMRQAFERDSSLAFKFGTWRAEVARWECENAARVQLLATTVLTLIELRDHFEPEAVDRAIGTVGDWVSRVWRADVPITGDVRAWATNATFRSDVLPREWRRL